ncbi:hypothetical protein [Helicobacter pametensis]|uniref:hypothetical protein n=1 Tax=Helicobacter pametensis TaxID=95149 RepID=UPI000487A195|nr:hypothetical protein [Helicobacter pametensis]
MKFRNICLGVLAFCASVYADPSQLVETKVFQDAGTQIQNEQFMLVKKVGVKGDEIKKHNHPGYSILLTMVRGDITVMIGDQTFDLKSGQVLSFDGENFISAKYNKKSEFYFTLIKK